MYHFAAIQANWNVAASANALDYYAITLIVFHPSCVAGHRNAKTVSFREDFHA
jgi:hypothetical protein